MIYIDYVNKVICYIIVCQTAEPQDRVTNKRPDAIWMHTHTKFLKITTS
jgi:hypothetical protein